MARSTLARIATYLRDSAPLPRRSEKMRRMPANPTVLVIQHEVDTPLAALEPPISALGVRTVTWGSYEQDEPPEGPFDGVIVLGGEVNPDGTGGDYPLDREREVIADAHARGGTERE